RTPDSDLFIDVEAGKMPPACQSKSVGFESPLRVPKARSAFHPHAQGSVGPSPRCASTIQMVRPLESMAETQPKLQPALLRLSAMISQSLTPLPQFLLSGEFPTP